jgi:hypothetical protein
MLREAARTATRALTRTALIATLASTLVVPVASTNAGATEQLMPPQLKAFVNVTGTRYANNRHYASGKLRLNNTSDSRMTVDCQVTLTWKRPNGDTAKRHRDLDGLEVGAHSIRKAHWHMMFKDPDHLYLNIPSNAAPHCRL